MFRKINKSATLLAAAIAALVFCIPVAIYIQIANYDNLWLLYMGSFLFMIALGIYTGIDSRKRNHDRSATFMIFSALVTVITSIIICCLICFLLLSLMVPGFLQPGPAGKTLANDPVSAIHDKTGGMSTNIFMTAILINFFVGSIAGLMLPFMLKKSTSSNP